MVVIQILITFSYSNPFYLFSQNSTEHLYVSLPQCPQLRKLQLSLKIIIKASIMRLTKLIQSFSVLNRLKARERIHQGTNYPRTATESIEYVQKEALNSSLSPFQQYLISSKAMERPFTGKLWDQVSPGFYHCLICDTRLFTFNHKFHAHTGYASFWKAIEGTVQTVDEDVTFDEVNDMRAKHKSAIDKSVYRRCQCAKCSTHLGAVFLDGPPPTFLRYSINSDLLSFYDFPDFPNPHAARKDKRKASRKKKITYVK